MQEIESALVVEIVDEANHADQLGGNHKSVMYVLDVQQQDSTASTPAHIPHLESRRWKSICDMLINSAK